jgi:hypothetical protein
VAFHDRTGGRLDFASPDRRGRLGLLSAAVKPCGPNGHPGLPLATDRLIVQTAAAGVLIGKFGGSNAGRGEAGAFVIGSQCIVPMPERKNALLFIGINGAVPRPAAVLDRIRLEICGACDP